MPYPAYDSQEPSIYDVLRQMSASMQNPQHWKELGQGTARATKSIPSMAESLGRGALGSTLGSFGDVESLGRMIAGNQNPTILPTTEDILKKIPRMSAPTEGTEDLEMMGGAMSPVIAKGASMARSPLNNMHYQATRGMRKPVFGTEVAVTNPSTLRNIPLTDTHGMGASRLRLQEHMPQNLKGRPWSESQGAWQGSEGFEANPLFTTELPAHRGRVLDQPYMKDLAQLSQNLNQDANAVTRFTPQLFQQPSKANSAMMNNITPEMIRRMGQEGLTNDMVIASRPNNKALIMGFDDSKGGMEDLVRRVQQYSPKSKPKYGTSNQDIDRVYMMKNDEGWAPSYESLGAIR